MYWCPECKKQFEYDAPPRDDDVLICPYCHTAIMLYETFRPGPGRIIGDFRLLERIGQGGMGEVYLAEQISVGRRVALKILPNELPGNRRTRDRFMKEIKTTAQLEHPAIVTALDAGIDRDICYFAMTYVDGCDLETWLHTRGRLPEDRALKYAIRIAGALEYAWEQHRLLHRDIKPGNIIVSRDDEAFLLDMGIAQHFSETFARQDRIDGSPYYMSPEQTQGRPLNWTSDLYSLGASLYHLLVGVPPYDAEDIDAIMSMHSHDAFPEPHSRNPRAELAPATVALLRRMMAKDPEQRFRSWHEFMVTAGELYSALASGARPEHLAAVTAERGKRHYRRGTLGLVIAVAAVIFCAVSFKLAADRGAERKLRIAEAYALRDDYEFEPGLRLFRSALDSSSRWLVSGAKRRRARQGYVRARMLWEREQIRQRDFARGMTAVEKLVQRMPGLSGSPLAQSCRMAEELLAEHQPVLVTERDRYTRLSGQVAVARSRLQTVPRSVSPAAATTR
ncbi:MAG: serine/threonine-protein kinase [Victivallales bacterium]|nr:serine/threonine-protein kinase [Victivallales bacterium]